MAAPLRDSVLADRRAWVPNANTYTAFNAAAGGDHNHADAGLDSEWQQRDVRLDGGRRRIGLLAGSGKHGGREQLLLVAEPGRRLTATVNGLPTNGSTIYVTLYSLIGGAWVPNAYTYTALSAAAGGVITTPAPGATLSGSMVTFSWTAGAGASAYWLVMGSTAGGNDYYSSGNLGNALTATVDTASEWQHHLCDPVLLCGRTVVEQR